MLESRVQSDDLARREKPVCKVIRVKSELVEQRALAEYRAGTEPMDKRAKLAGSGLLVAKEIQVTRDRMVTLGRSVTAGQGATKAKRVTPGSLGNLDLLDVMASKVQRVKEESLEIQVHRDQKDQRGLTVNQDRLVNREGEESMGRRERRDQMDSKGRRESEGHSEPEAGRGKTD